MIGNPRILSIFGLSETRVQLLIDIERASNSGGEIKLPTIYLTREDSISMGEVNLGGEIFLGNSPDNQLGNVRSWDDVLCKYRSPEAIKMLENLGLVTIQSELPSWNRILNGPVTVNATLTDEGRVALALTKRLQRVRTQYDDKSRSYIHINSDEFNGLRILLKIIAETLYENSRNNETKNLNEEGAQALSKEAIATYGLAFAKLFEHYAHIKMGAIADTTLFAKELETARDFNKRFSC